MEGSNKLGISRQLNEWLFKPLKLLVARQYSFRKKCRIVDASTVMNGSDATVLRQFSHGFEVATKYRSLHKCRVVR